MKPTLLITFLASLLLSSTQIHGKFYNRQITAEPIPSCAQSCVDGISSASSSCAAGDIPCRCLDSNVLKTTADCVKDNCSGEDLTDATLAVGSYCASEAVSGPPDFSDPSAMASYSSRQASLDSLLSTNTLRLGDDDPTSSGTIGSASATLTNGPTAVRTSDPAAGASTSLVSGDGIGSGSGGSGGSGAGLKVEGRGSLGLAGVGVGVALLGGLVGGWF